MTLRGARLERAHVVPCLEHRRTRGAWLGAVTRTLACALVRYQRSMGNWLIGIPDGKVEIRRKLGIGIGSDSWKGWLDQTQWLRRHIIASVTIGSQRRCERTRDELRERIGGWPFTPCRIFKRCGKGAQSTLQRACDYGARLTLILGRPAMRTCQCAFLLKVRRVERGE